MQGEFNLAGALPASPLLGSVRPLARGALHCNGFSGRIADSPHSHGKKATWETKNVASRNYFPANVTNIVIQIRRGEESQPDVMWLWNAYQRGLARTRPISDGHFPVVGAEDGTHHVGDLTERGVDDRGVPARAPLSVSPPPSADPPWPVHGQDRDACGTEEVHQARRTGHDPEDGGQKTGKKLLIDFEQCHRSDPAIA